MKALLKFVLINILIVLFSLDCFGQKEQVDIIYLENGSVIKGTILSYDAEHGVKIKTLENYQWTLKIEDIKKIERKNFNSQLLDIPSDIPTTGFINYTSLGILAGNGNNQRNAPFSILMSNGYMMQNKFSINLGTGIEFFSESYLPVFLDLRYHLTARKITPYLSLQGGYSFALDNDANTYDYYSAPKRPLGGYLLNPEAGIIINFMNYTAVYFSAGYRHQLLRYKERQFEEAYINQYLNRLSIRMGFIFR